MTDVIRKGVLKKLTEGDYNCEKEYTLSMFSGKYKLIILWELGHVGDMHFSELQKTIGDVSKKVLSDQLHELISDRLISRDSYQQNNRQFTRYSMTTDGRSLLPILDQMYKWGKKRLAKYQVPSTFKLDVSQDL